MTIKQIIFGDVMTCKTQDELIQFYKSFASKVRTNPEYTPEIKDKMINHIQMRIFNVESRFIEQVEI